VEHGAISKRHRFKPKPLTFAERRHVGLAVINGEVPPVMIYAQPCCLGWRHLVQNLDAPGRADQ
jgi:hypothetical protein